MPVPPGAGICLGRWLRLGFRLRHNARTDLRVVRPTALGGIGRAGQAQGNSADDPGGHNRQRHAARWAQTLVVNTATVAPDAITALVKAYGDRFVAAEILGAPQAVRSGTATFVVGGPASARAALAPVWSVFAGVLDVGDRAETAAIMKLLNNQMLLAQVAVIAETVRAGRAAGIDDTTLAATLRESKMMPEGLRNRIDVLFDPDHAGWFNSVQAVKDATLALELAQGGAPLPVTEAARDAYRQVVQDGWQTHDVTTLVEYGRLAVAGLAGAAALSRKTTYEAGRTQPPGPPRVGSRP